MVILAPVAEMLVQMAISRGREFEADRGGAEISGRPDWLANALEKIATSAQRVPNMDAERNPATAHMFIVNPLNLRGVDGLFSTHPRTVDRVMRLRAMASEMGVSGAPGHGIPSASGGPWGRARSAGPWG